MRLAAVRTLGIGLALFAIGKAIVVMPSVRATDENAIVAWSFAAVTIAVTAWVASLLLRRPHVFTRGVILLVIALLIVPAISMTWDGEMGALHLTPREREAFEYLRDAESFQAPHIGISAAYSGGYLAMRIIGRSRSADAAFKELVRGGTTAGQLYGLCGVRRTDILFYRVHAWRYASREDEVGFDSGCVFGSQRIGELVRTANGARLAPGETLQTYWEKHHGRVPNGMDIDGGGLSSEYLDRDYDEAAAFAAERAYDFGR